MSEDKHSKTEKPTAKRLKEAKDEGNVARTPDLSAWLTVIAFVALGPYTVTALRDTFVTLFEAVPRLAATPDLGLIGPVLQDATAGFFKAAGPFVLTCMVLGTMGHVLQGGLSFNSKRWKPKWKKLNPGPGIKNMFGKQSLWTLGKTLIKFVVFGLVAYNVAKGVVNTIAGNGSWSLSAVTATAADAAMTLLRIVAIAGLVIAAADWAMEKRRVGESLKMTKDEIKRESKMQEGDPHAKAARKQRAREMANSRMMANMGEATVVMVNPAHVAVALRYEQGGGAPEVVAKGAGHLAARIRAAAEEHEIPMVRDPLVTRMLYKMCEVGSFIPPELYDAIAQVVAFVFHLDQMGKAGGTHDTPVEHEDGGVIPDELSDKALGIPDIPDDEDEDGTAAAGGAPGAREGSAAGGGSQV